MQFIKDIASISINDLPLVGGKTASLGEMHNSLMAEGISIPPGFAVTTEAFDLLLTENQLHQKISDELSPLDGRDLSALSQAGRRVRQWIKFAVLPVRVKQEITAAYEMLNQKLNLKECDVAVRSSATAEDLPGASFAGQQETFLNIQGEEDLLTACMNCFASLFTDRAISYRINKGFRHTDVKLSICVQKMVRADLGSSGVMFTLDPESGASNVILITSSYGLGENIVGGKVEPDEFVVQKELLGKADSPIIQRRCGAKQMRLVYSGHGAKTTVNKEVSELARTRYSLADDKVIKLAAWGKLIEEHYSLLNLKPMPMDIEWALDGQTGELYILQARPETVHTARKGLLIENFTLLERGAVLLVGRSVGSKIGSGKVRIIKTVDQLTSFKPGEVLVADMTDPDWEPVMKKASAIITNRGGRTCHAAIVSREHGVPCLVATGTASETLQDGQEVTVSCAEGDEGYVYDGLLKFNRVETNRRERMDTVTKVMVNLANPSGALKASLLPVDGVGLARMEFIIGQLIRIHPMALVNYETIGDDRLKKEISDMLGPYRQNPTGYFIDKLADGIGSIAGAFYPRPVIIRFSDFKTNEYRNLVGGQGYEPEEENPMIGFRGACRYYSKLYREGFTLECRAIKKAREVMGLRNIKVMVPFCRTPEEGRLVLQEMKNNGLARGDQGLEVYVMAEIPSNALLVNEFSRTFDGFSIGSNDLTQLTLGVDRDSERLSPLFNERDPAAMRLMSMVIRGARKSNLPVGICGQAPSDYPEVTKLLVAEGISSISVTPDAVFKTIDAVEAAEENRYEVDKGEDISGRDLSVQLKMKSNSEGKDSTPAS